MSLGSLALRKVMTIVSIVSPLIRDTQLNWCQHNLKITEHGQNDANHSEKGVVLACVAKSVLVHDGGHRKNGFDVIVDAIKTLDRQQAASNFRRLQADVTVSHAPRTHGFQTTQRPGLEVVPYRIETRITSFDMGASV